MIIGICATDFLKWRDTLQGPKEYLQAGLGIGVKMQGLHIRCSRISHNLAPGLRRFVV